jgi:RimJ/RimL family protein N-acetyltransferase
LRELDFCRDTPRRCQARPRSEAWEADVVTLETERMVLRPFQEKDLEAYARICAGPEVMRFLGDGRALSRAEAWRQMAFFLGHWQLRGYGLWAAELKQNGALVGRIGLHNPKGWPGLEVGWLLDRTVWGQGLATEGGRAALDFAFATLAAGRVISVIQPGNTRSIRVAERLGERFERRDAINGIEVAIYALDRPERLEAVN